MPGGRLLSHLRAGDGVGVGVTFTDILDHPMAFAQFEYLEPDPWWPCRRITLTGLAQCRRGLVRR